MLIQIMLVWMNTSCVSLTYCNKVWMASLKWVTLRHHGAPLVNISISHNSVSLPINHLEYNHQILQSNSIHNIWTTHTIYVVQNIQLWSYDEQLQRHCVQIMQQRRITCRRWIGQSDQVHQKEGIRRQWLSRHLDYIVQVYITRQLLVIVKYLIMLYKWNTLISQQL